MPPLRRNRPQRTPRDPARPGRRRPGVESPPVGPQIPEIPDLPDMPDLEPSIVFRALSQNIPFLMLPVRIETRFYHNPHRLRIRIYPDQIHVNSHQSALSPREAQLGRRFWEVSWKMGAERAKQIFKRLADTLGVWRAAWVMEATTPTNIAAFGSGEPAFPKLDESKTRAAPASLELLPTRWFAVGYLHGEIVMVEYGEPITAGLHLAPFEAQSGTDSERWLKDFEAAKRVGMALEVALEGSKRVIADQGLDELFVIGTCTGEPRALAQMLETTLQGHYYTRGFDFAPQGTPTNNTESVRSPWSWESADSDLVFERIWQPAATLAGSYRERFSSALGLDADGIASRAVHGEIIDIPSMEAMNQALWYVTWGEYLRFMLNHDGDSVLDDDTLEWAREWFSGQVHGGAPYPAFHIGAIPYGVLPIQIQPVPLNPQDSETYLQTALWYLRAGWEQSLVNVPHLDPAAVASADDAPIETDLEQVNDNLIALLSSHPHPASFYIRESNNLRTMPFWSLLFDPVDLYEGQKELLAPKVTVFDPTWGRQIDDQLKDTFQSLPEQAEYFEDIIAVIDEGIEALEKEIQDICDTFDGPLPVEVAELIAAKQDAIDERNAARLVANNIIRLLDSHAERVAPHNTLGLPRMEEVLSAETPNVDQFYFAYKSDDDVTAWGGLPFAQAPDAADGSTTAVYLPWLVDYARDAVTGDGPEGISDPAPLLFQLLKHAIDRAREWDNTSIFVIDGILNDLNEVGGLSSAARVSKLHTLEKDVARLTNATRILSSALQSKPDDPVLLAFTSVPADIYIKSANALRTYQRVMRRKSPRLEEMIVLLDQCAVQPRAFRTVAAAPFGTKVPGTLKYLPTSRGRHVNEIALAIEVLAALTPGDLELRMQETLGLAMHRLDAWISAYAEQRLSALRSKQPAGIQIGGFSWVENLRPDAAGTASSQGYIHAPSMTQAAAAAVLRSGYSAYSDDSATSPLSIDLRSDRVRVAAWLMDGLRQGQRLNDLLGYRFERYLHDHRLDIWIEPVRDVIREQGTTELSNSRQKVIVDGLALLELWDEGRGSLQTLLPSVTDATGGTHAFAEIVPALKTLVMTTDAMSDLILAESVHALVQGDYERATAVYAASALGDVAPPEARSVLTPNTGRAITHRIAILPQAQASPWNGQDVSIRSRTEPTLESWAASILGSPEYVRFRIALEDGSIEVASLANLPVTALDAIYLVPPDGGSLTGSPLGTLILSEWCRTTGTSAGVSIIADVPVEEEEITLGDFILLANRLRAVLSSARAAVSSDFVPGTTETNAGINLEELVRRIDRLVNEFAGAASGIEVRSGAPFSALLRLSYFNLPQAIPTTFDEALLAQQLASVITGATKRRNEVVAKWSALRSNAATMTTEQVLRGVQDTVALILGRDFPLMPRFNVSSTGAVFQDEAALSQTDPSPVAGWLLKIARVHPDIAVFRDLITAAEALRDQEIFRFSIAQQPHITGEPWIGTQRPLAVSDRISIAFTTNGTAASLQGEIGGLIVDQWIERIPTDHEMTGVAVHFDAPSSRPPQTLLLAMPPESDGWSLDAAVAVVREAFAMARLRAVAPETLGEYGHQLPAVYLITHPDTIGAESDGE